MNYLFFDFEFYNSQESIQNLVCCSLMENNGPIESFWLYDGDGINRLRDRLKKFKGCLVSFNATAEARSLFSLDLNPLDFKWIDLHAEWKAVQNCNDTYSYGCYFKDGVKRY